MKTFTARFRQVGSLIAGVLIGLSMVMIVCMFTMTAAESSHSQILLALGSSIVFAAGFMLQINMTATPRARTIDAPHNDVDPRSEVQRGN